MMVALPLGLIVVGLVMAWLSSAIKQQLIQKIVYWIGIALVVVGVILLSTPFLVWIDRQLRSMLNA